MKSILSNWKNNDCQQWLRKHRAGKAFRKVRSFSKLSFQWISNRFESPTFLSRAVVRHEKNQMNPIREQYLKDKEKSAKELFEKIKNNPKPDITDLWTLQKDYFIEWRKLHDFPKLLNHFDKTLLLFKEWKSDNNLNDDIILRNGELTPFLEKKKLSKKKKLFLIEQTHENKTRTFVAYEKFEGEKNDFGKKFYFKVLLEFYSYLDWLEQRGKSENILYINSRTAPASDYESVRIHSDVYSASKDFELLKMGGLDAPVNGFGILLRGKRLEFVNVCGLRLKGEINFGEEGNLSFS